MRRYDGETLIKKLDSSLKKKKEFYVVALRLAGLDEIASKYGYEVNNKIEQMIYAFLADNSSKKDVFCLSPLVYAVYLEKDERGATVFANLLRERFKRNFYVKGISAEIIIPCTVKIIPVLGQDKDSKQISELINFAVEEPVGMAKEITTFVDDDAVEKIEKSADLEKKIENAVRTGDFKVFYQPIVDFESNHADSAEAFVRLYDENKELLNTDELIKIAKANGSIIQITDYVMGRVCRLIKTGILEDKDMKYIQVNLSVNDWRDPRLYERLMSVVKSNEVGTGQIMLELTEECICEDMAQITKNVEELNRVGFHLAMDNFGVSGNNISQMLHLPLEAVKIDKDMVSRAHNNTYDMDILSGMVSLFEKFKLQIIAEGIENAAQHDMVVDLGCTQGQGNMYGVPVSEEVFVGEKTE